MPTDFKSGKAERINNRLLFNKNRKILDIPLPYLGK